MGNSLNNSESTDSLANLIGSEGFDKLSDENKGKLIAAANTNKAKEGGAFGYVFGVNSVNAAMHIAFVICVLLLGVGLIINDSQYWDKTVPIIAATIGYLFGKGKI